MIHPAPQVAIHENANTNVDTTTNTNTNTNTNPDVIANQNSNINANANANTNQSPTVNANPSLTFQYKEKVNDIKTDKERYILNFNRQIIDLDSEFYTQRKIAGLIFFQTHRSWLDPVIRLNVVIFHMDNYIEKSARTLAIDPKDVTYVKVSSIGFKSRLRKLLVEKDVNGKCALGDALHCPSLFKPMGNQMITFQKGEFVRGAHHILLCNGQDVSEKGYAQFCVEFEPGFLEKDEQLRCVYAYPYRDNGLPKTKCIEVPIVKEGFQELHKETNNLSRQNS